MTIDATTEPGFVNQPIIVLDGSAATGNSVPGLDITGGGVTIRGLAIERFSGAGISIDGGFGDLIAGNEIGTDSTGLLDRGMKSGYGILVSGFDNTIGGTTAPDRNVIAANNGGVALSGGLTAGNLVTGNYIGVDATGEAKLGNGNAGILISGSGDNTIGGTTLGAGNIISGNDTGIDLEELFASGPRADHNLVQGNFIGTDAMGAHALGNGSNGVSIGTGADGNTIGGTLAGAGNVISGNGVYTGQVSPTQKSFLAGVTISGYGDGARNNIVQGNRIGTAAAAANAVPNAGAGVYVELDAAGTFVGGQAPGAGNVIAGNKDSGVFLNAPNIVVAGNFIGTDATGTAHLGNGASGVFVQTSGNTIGGTAAGTGNVIAYNARSGVSLPAGNAPPTGDVVLGSIFYGNASGLGIDLNDDGPTENYAGPIPAGGLPSANHLQDAPVIIGSMAASGGVTTVAGTLHGLPTTAYTVQFFAATTDDSGEGRLFLGSGPATTDANGNASFSIGVPLAVPAGEIITATATDPAGDTSEFGRPTFAPGPLVELVATALTSPAPHVAIGSSGHVIAAAATSMTVTLQAQDQSSIDADGVLLEYALTTQGAAINSASAAGQSAIATGRFVLVNVGHLAAGATTTLTVTLAPAQAGQPVDGEVRVEGNEFDPKPYDNVLLVRADSAGSVTVLKQGYAGAPVLLPIDNVPPSVVMGQPLAMSAQVVKTDDTHTISYSLVPGTRRSPRSITRGSSSTRRPAPLTAQFTINVKDDATALIDFKAFMINVVGAPPTATVAPLPAATHTATFNVQWNGQSSVPIASYDVYASVDGGPLAIWLTGTTQTQASYTGMDGHSYGFAVAATSTLGVRSPTPTSPQATTQVQTSAATSTALQAGPARSY